MEDPLPLNVVRDHGQAVMGSTMDHAVVISRGKDNVEKMGDPLLFLFESFTPLKPIAANDESFALLEAPNSNGASYAGKGGEVLDGSVADGGPTSDAFNDPSKRPWHTPLLGNGRTG